jgi:hypothetical protein
LTGLAALGFIDLIADDLSTVAVTATANGRGDIGAWSASAAPGRWLAAPV